MLSVAAVIASLAFLGLVIVAIPVLIQVRRTARTAELTLSAIEREVRPLTSQVHALLQDHRDLAQRATRNLREVEDLAGSARELMGRVNRLTGVLGSLGTVGRALAVAQGLRKGAAVFVNRMGRRG